MKENMKVYVDMLRGVTEDIASLAAAYPDLMLRPTLSSEETEEVLSDVLSGVVLGAMHIYVTEHGLEYDSEDVISLAAALTTVINMELQEGGISSRVNIWLQDGVPTFGLI